MEVTLRKLTPEHFEQHVRWRNANKEHFTPQPDWTVAGQEKWYAGSYLRNAAFHLFVVAADEAPVGVLAFNSATREIGPVLLGEEGLRRKGIMTQAMHELYRAFGPGLYWLRVVEGNAPAVTLYEKDGFRRADNLAVAVSGTPDGQFPLARYVMEHELS